jgi:hypothetical protein
VLLLIYAVPFLLLSNTLVARQEQELPYKRFPPIDQSHDLLRGIVKRDTRYLDLRLEL